MALLQVDGEKRSLASEPTMRPHAHVGADNMCYIIFTSGSTGRPKGAVLQHAGVINYLHCLTTCEAALLSKLSSPAAHVTASRLACVLMRVSCGRKLDLGPSDVFLQKAPVSFDTSVQELFNSLACGGVLLLAEPGGERDTQYLARLCKEHCVTCASFVPSQLDALLQAQAQHPPAM